MDIVGRDNKVIFNEDLIDLRKINITINGSENKILFNGRMKVNGSLSINMRADKNTIIFEDDILINRVVNIYIIPAGSGCPSYGNTVSIGKSCFFNGITNFILAIR